MREITAPAKTMSISGYAKRPSCNQLAAVNVDGNIMFRVLTTSSPRELMKWCAYALVLLVPGSFVVLPVLWLVRGRRTYFLKLPGTKT